MPTATSANGTSKIGTAYGVGNLGIIAPQPNQTRLSYRRPPAMQRSRTYMRGLDAIQFLSSGGLDATSAATMAALSRRGNQDCRSATMRTALGRSRARPRSATGPDAPRRAAFTTAAVDGRRP